MVIDEVHAFAGDDRGWHLQAVLARLSRLAGHPIQRIGLSATVGKGTVPNCLFLATDEDQLVAAAALIHLWDQAKRSRLVANLRQLVGHLHQVGIDRIYLDGSFCTDKPSPGDIDGYFVTDFPNWRSRLGRLQQLDPAWTYEPIDRLPNKHGQPKWPQWFRYGIEFFPVFDPPWHHFSFMGTGTPPTTTGQQLLHYSSIRRALDEVARHEVSQAVELPWISRIKPRLERLSTPIERERLLAKLRHNWSRLWDEEVPKPDDRAEQFLHRLIEWGIIHERSDGRFDVPDLYRAGFDMVRKGGVRIGQRRRRSRA